MKKLVSDMVTTAFEIVGDLQDTVVFKQRNPSTYDPVTDTMTEPFTTTTFLGVFARFRATEVDASVVTLTDAKLLFPADRLQTAPKVTDTLTMKGKNWEVHRIMSVPGDSLYKLHIREK